MQTVEEQHDQIDHNFTNHPPMDLDIGDILDRVTEEFIRLAKFVVDNSPRSREQSLALTNLEQASMWTKAAIARHQGED